MRQKSFLVLPHMVPGYISEDMKELEQIVGLQTDKPSETCIYALWRYPYGSSGSRDLRI